MRYPTAADAAAAGYHLVAGFGPGSGRALHRRHPRCLRGGFDPSKPPSLIYDGTSPTSQIVGPHVLRRWASTRARRLRRSERPLAPPQQRVHQFRNGGSTSRSRRTPTSPRRSARRRAALHDDHGLDGARLGRPRRGRAPPASSPTRTRTSRCADGTFNTDKIGAARARDEGRPVRRGPADRGAWMRVDLR